MKTEKHMPWRFITRKKWQLTVGLGIQCGHDLSLDKHVPIL